MARAYARTYRDREPVSDRRVERDDDPVSVIAAGLADAMAVHPTSVPTLYACVEQDALEASSADERTT